MRSRQKWEQQTSLSGSSRQISRKRKNEPRDSFNPSDDGPRRNIESVPLLKTTYTETIPEMGRREVQIASTACTVLAQAHRNLCGAFSWWWSYGALFGKYSQ